MITEWNQIDPSLSLLFTELKIEYFNFKRNLQTKGEESIYNNLNIVFELIDKQHLLLKAFEQDNRTLLNELSYKKLIIERKSSILKEVNSVVLNKFIDRNYRQEILISQLQAEIEELKRVNRKEENIANKQLNTIVSLPNMFNQEKVKRKQINAYQVYKDRSMKLNKKKEDMSVINLKSNTGFGYPAMHTSVNVTSSQTLINLYKCYLNTPKPKLIKIKSSKYFNIKNRNNIE